MKIFYQLFFALLLGLLFIISVDHYFSYSEEVWQFERDLVKNSIQDGRSISGMIRHVWIDNGEQKALELLEDASIEGRIKARWVWADELVNSEVIKQEQIDVAASFESNSPFSVKLNTSENPSILTYIPVALPLKRHGGLEIEQSLLPLKSYQKKMLIRSIVISCVVAIVFGTILYLYITLKIRRPIEQLMDHTRRIGKGDLRVAEALPKDNELGLLSETINDMCSRLLISREKIKFEYEARLQTIEKLRHTEQLSNLGILAAGIAHEIGTPLNVIEGRSRMITEAAGNHESICHNSDIIHKQCEKISYTIRQLLDYSRRPKQQVARENIQFIVKQVFQLIYPLAKKQDVTLNIIVEENMETSMEVDGNQLQQVFVNLLMNSIQAMPHGGDVTVSMTTHIEKSQDITKPDSTFMQIEISDEGGGIEPKNMKDIFTPFFTTKAMGAGTGLGLSIAHEIIQEHGGWINVRNVEKGSCFTIYMPMEGIKA